MSFFASALQTNNGRYAEFYARDKTIISVQVYNAIIVYTLFYIISEEHFLTMLVLPLKLYCILIVCSQIQ